MDGEMAGQRAFLILTSAQTWTSDTTWTTIEANSDIGQLTWAGEKL